MSRHRGGVVFDVSGCARTIGPPDVIAREVAALASAGFRKTGSVTAARVAIAPTATAAWLLAQARPGPTVAEMGAAALAAVPLGVLETIQDLDRPATASETPRAAVHAAHLAESCRDRLAIFERWGLKTLGDLAALPGPDVSARLGPMGARLHQAAWGGDVQPFAPVEEPRPFAERMELEWPIDGLEPLAFVLARLFDGLSAALERADRGAVVIRTRLRLVTRDTHERVLTLPSPIAEARVLRTLVLLDLESHPPAAAIDAVDLDLEVAPGCIVIGSLFAAALPLAEDLATLTARLGALMGETRVGAPVLVDSYDARATAMTPFSLPKPRQGKGQRAEGTGKVGGEREEKGAPTSARSSPLPSAGPLPCLRRLRLPVAAHVVVDGGVPVRVMPSARGMAGGAVINRAGPWRTSGAWWTFNRAAWDRDEWELELADGALYRVTRDRRSGSWEIDGILD